MIAPALLAIAAFALGSLLSGAPWLEATLPGGLPAGNALAALALCALAGAAVAMGRRGTAPWTLSVAALAAASAWLPLSIVLAGNLALNFDDGRGDAWVLLSLVVLALVLCSLVCALVAALRRRRRSGRAPAA